MNDLWTELSASMRVLRQNAGLSLRQAEVATGRGRGILSQIETAKARPNRDLVEWYDAELGGDGVLAAMFFEARGAYGADAPTRNVRRRVRDGDSARVCGQTLAYGAIVPTGAADLTASWSLANDGSVPWVGRCVRRIGAYGAVRLIVSGSGVAVPSCAPGALVDIHIGFTAPAVPGTCAAYWQMVDEDGNACFEETVLLSVLVVVAEGVA